MCQNYRVMEMLLLSKSTRQSKVVYLYFTIIQQCRPRPNFHSLANCFWENNVVSFVFCETILRTGHLEDVQNEFFQMLAVVCRLIRINKYASFSSPIFRVTPITKSGLNGEKQLFITYSANYLDITMQYWCEGALS